MSDEVPSRPPGARRAVGRAVGPRDSSRVRPRGRRGRGGAGPGATGHRRPGDLLRHVAMTVLGAAVPGTGYLYTGRRWLGRGARRLWWAASALSSGTSAVTCGRTVTDLAFDPDTR